MFSFCYSTCHYFTVDYMALDLCLPDPLSMHGLHGASNSPEGNNYVPVDPDCHEDGVVCHFYKANPEALVGSRIRGPRSH